MIPRVFFIPAKKIMSLSQPRKIILQLLSKKAQSQKIIKNRNIFFENSPEILLDFKYFSDVKGRRCRWPVLLKNHLFRRIPW